MCVCVCVREGEETRPVLSVLLKLHCCVDPSHGRMVDCGSAIDINCCRALLAESFCGQLPDVNRPPAPLAQRHRRHLSGRLGRVDVNLADCLCWEQQQQIGSDRTQHICLRKREATLSDGKRWARMARKARRDACPAPCSALACSSSLAKICPPTRSKLAKPAPGSSSLARAASRALRACGMGRMGMRWSACAVTLAAHQSFGRAGGHLPRTQLPPRQLRELLQLSFGSWATCLHRKQRTVRD